MNSKDDVKIISKEVLHRGYCRVERYVLQNRLFSGEWSEPYAREILRRLNAAAVLPYDPVLNKVVMIEQFRIGALWLQSGNPWILELVAGVADKNEHLEKLAVREVKEEVGLDVLALTPVYHYLSSPGGSSEEISLFCAKVDAAKAPRFAGVKEENEDIKVHVFDVKEAFDKVASGLINNDIAIIALQWLELNLTKIRTMWGN